MKTAEVYTQTFEAPVCAGRTQTSVPTRVPGSSGVVERIEESIRYMQAHLNEPLQVSTLAAVANFSPSHFFALFKRCTGCAPIDFFIRLRMDRACHLLEQTSMNVKEVAAALGYEDPFYFSRTFKQVNRVSPTEYRQLPGDRQWAVRDGASRESNVPPLLSMPEVPGRESRLRRECEWRRVVS
jgi:transcriptional regulator GlxA family with amidase domain